MGSVIAIVIVWLFYPLCLMIMIVITILVQGITFGNMLHFLYFERTKHFVFLRRDLLILGLTFVVQKSGLALNVVHVVLMDHRHVLWSIMVGRRIHRFMRVILLMLHGLPHLVDLRVNLFGVSWTSLWFSECLLGLRRHLVIIIALNSLDIISLLFLPTSTAAFLGCLVSSVRPVGFSAIVEVLEDWLFFDGIVLLNLDDVVPGLLTTMYGQTKSVPIFSRTPRREVVRILVALIWVILPSEAVIIWILLANAGLSLIGICSHLVPRDRIILFWVMKRRLAKSIILATFSIVWYLGFEVIKSLLADRRSNDPDFAQTFITGGLITMGTLVSTLVELAPGIHWMGGLIWLWAHDHIWVRRRIGVLAVSRTFVIVSFVQILLL